MELAFLYDFLYTRYDTKSNAYFGFTFYNVVGIIMVGIVSLEHLAGTTIVVIWNRESMESMLFTV